MFMALYTKISISLNSIIRHKSQIPSIIPIETGRYDDNLFGQNTLMRHIIDAILTEHLTSSPNIINGYAYCAHSTINDFADKSLKHIHISRRLTIRKKAEYVRDVARGLADLHGAESGEESLSMAVYNDLKPPNLVLMDDKVVLSDFNNGEILLRNAADGKQCYFQRHHMGTQIHVRYMQMLPFEEVYIHLPPTIFLIYIIGSIILQKN